MAVEQYKVEEFLYGNVEKVMRKGNGYVGRCPICGDSKKRANKRRLHVDYFPKYDEWMYKCYNGGCPENAGNIQQLYSHVMGCSWKEANDELRDKKYDSDKVKKRVGKKEKFIDEVDENNQVLDINTQDCITLEDIPDGRVQSKYLSMLKEFVVDRSIPLKYKPMVCFNGRYKNRYILPVFVEGKMVYFQGRAIHNFLEPKYLNPVVVKENIVLNIDKMDPTKPIVLCEGLIDAFSVEGYQGTSCLGASVSDELIENIYKVHPKADIIIALDNPDIDESGYKNYFNIMEENKYATKLRYFFMPGDTWKDLSDVRKAKGLKFNMLDFIEKNTRNHFKASIELRKVL